MAHNQALITGASSGIGAAFARELASQGYDLILVARRRERLEKLCAELTAANNIASEIIVADLAKDDDVERVVEKIRTTDRLSMLINNAGFGTRGTIAEADFGRQREMIAVHVLATVALCHAALPGMLTAGRGDIINVASVAGFMRAPGSVTYCSTKAYLITFSEGLQYEVAGHGLRVQALCPGYTYSEFHEVGELADFDRSAIPKGWWFSAETVVRKSLRALDKGKVIYIPGLRYWLVAAVFRCPVLTFLLKPIIMRARNKHVEKTQE